MSNPQEEKKSEGESNPRASVPEDVNETSISATPIQPKSIEEQLAEKKEEHKPKEEVEEKKEEKGKEEGESSEKAPEEGQAAEDAGQVDMRSLIANALSGPGTEGISSLLADVAVHEAVQSRLQQLLGTASGYVESLPACVKRRIEALQKLHEEHEKVEEELQEAMKEIERQFEEKFQGIYKKRSDIVNGVVEVEAAEPKAPEGEEANAKETEDGTKIGEGAGEAAEIKGIPDFWLSVMGNTDVINNWIEDSDREALSYLSDIRCLTTPGSETFELQFEFKENPFFHNKVLTKKYIMIEMTENQDFEGAIEMLEHIVGTEIEWKADKNLTVHTVKKKQRKKGTKQTRTVTREEPQDSFFNYFRSMGELEDKEDLGQEDEEKLQTDYEMGMSFRHHLVPEAVKWFLGEGEESEVDDDEDEEEEEDYEEEDDEDYDPTQDSANAQQECNQQ